MHHIIIRSSLGQNPFSYSVHQKIKPRKRRKEKIVCVDAMPQSTTPPNLRTGHQVRLASRSNALAAPTSALAPSYLQANLVVLPSRHAPSFRLLCARNPVPCPLIAESASPGCYSSFRSHLPGVPDGGKLLGDVDVRRDAPLFNVYVDGALARENCADIASSWTEDHVAFLVGCSFSFEAALTTAGLTPRHVETRRNVPMYRTAVPLCPAGVFTGATYVVSMRPYRASEVERVRDVTRAYAATHGEPLDWGWDAVARLGIADLDKPEWGDAPLARDGRTALGSGVVGGSGDGDDDVPVFWGCGVTPQEAVMRAKLPGVVMAHAPGHMLLLDVQDHEVIS